MFFFPRLVNPSPYCRWGWAKGGLIRSISRRGETLSIHPHVLVCGLKQPTSLGGGLTRITPLFLPVLFCSGKNNRSAYIFQAQASNMAWKSDGCHYRQHRKQHKRIPNHTTSMSQTTPHA